VHRDKSVQPPGPFQSVTLPPGPEMPLSQIEGIARNEAGQAGEPSPAMSVGRGTLAAAMRMIDPSTTFPEATGQIGSMLSEQVVLVVMHGSFRLSIGTRLPKGGGVAVGSVLDLVSTPTRARLWDARCRLKSRRRKAFVSLPSLRLRQVS
jgi:hypothetical protein